MLIFILLDCPFMLIILIPFIILIISFDFPIMSDLNNSMNNSLIGFLKKKSLFSQSPIKSFQLKDRSKQKRQQLISPKSNYAGSQLGNSQSSKQLQQQASFRNYRQQTQSQAGHQSMHVQRPSRFHNSSFNQQIDQRQKAPKRTFNFQSSTNNKSLNATKLEQEDTSNIWTGLVNYSNSFQSARIQSVQCLQTMSIKLQAELKNINYKIDVFHSKMVQLLNHEFAVAKDKIYKIVNKVFEQSQHTIRIYIQQQQQSLAYDLLQMREALVKQYKKVQYMKEQINKPSWKKVAGELLSTQLQERIQQLLARSRQIDAKNWEVGDLGIAKVATLEGQLRDMIKLNTR